MFEGVELLDEADAALLQQILDRDLCAKYEHEITEAEYYQGLITDHRQAPHLAFARELSETDLNALSDAEAMERLVQVEAGIARAHALRARLVALVAANRPAADDRPDGQPGAAGAPTEGETSAQVVPEVLDVSEWLAHELQMATPTPGPRRRTWCRPRWSCPGG